MNWLTSLRTTAAAATGVDQPIFAVDGKTAWRSHDHKNDLGSLHSVSVWASEFGLSLGQVACEAKSNEITAIPTLLRLVDIKGSIITIDAMGTQKAIASEIIAGGAAYVLALKGNQETLYQAVIAYIDEQLEGDMVGVHEHVTEEKGHGRQETRTYLQLPVPKSLPGFAAWKGLRTIAMVTLCSVRDGKESIEVRYYISSLTMRVERFARAVWNHWSIENPQSEDRRGDNLCVVGQASYHRDRRPASSGRVERPSPEGPRRNPMLDNDPIRVPPRLRFLSRPN